MGVREYEEKQGSQLEGDMDFREIFLFVYFWLGKWHNMFIYCARNDPFPINITKYLHL